MTVRAGDRPAESYRVDYTLGSKRFQGYLSTLPDGRMYVLPVFWHVASGRWLDWKETTPIPGAQRELAESLRSFPESAPLQAALAWLLTQRGEAAAAEDAVRATVALDATLARPHVIRGVLAARAGRFDEALASWRRARDLEPATPNIDRMIEEAQRRVTPPRGR